MSQTGTNFLQHTKSEYQRKMYFSPEEAKQELMRRRSDPLLIKAVREVTGDLPHGLSDSEPFAALIRHVATARMEDVEFVAEMTRIGLSPIWVEYTQDLFTSRNPDKNALWKMFIFKGQSKNGNDRTARFRVIQNPCVWEYKRICDLVTPWGESLVEFHHRLRYEVFPPHIAERFIDASCWLKQHGGRASRYYRAYLSLFLTHGILCEDFEEFPDQPTSYPEFRENVFLPNWEWVVEKFGMSPIIVRLPWKKHLDWYHPDIEGVLKKNRVP